MAMRWPHSIFPSCSRGEPAYSHAYPRGNYSRRVTMLRCVKAVVVLLTLVGIPAAASAQASIVGIVKDASGAVLPGVGVEASSPALIEKTRSVVTNGAGQYAIQDLRPGTYAVTFTLPGFAPVRRDAIELAGTFIATVNADLRVGGVAETVTVSG